MKNEIWSRIKLLVIFVFTIWDNHNFFITLKSVDFLCPMLLQSSYLTNVENNLLNQNIKMNVLYTPATCDIRVELDDGTLK